MDILAHALWAGAGVTLASRHLAVGRRAMRAAVVMAVLPDLLQLLPIAAWLLAGTGSARTLAAYVVAHPGQEPPLPPLVFLWSHQLHCVMHSAVVAGGVTILAIPAWHRTWLPLLGWWSHIVIDVFTHAADFYPSPVLYPFTQRGFDGVAWNAPWFMALNYTALAVAFIGLLVTRRRARG